RGRVVAYREVLVAVLARVAPHLLDARPAVRPGGVAVQVAAYVLQLDELRRRAGERLLAQLGRAPGDPERRIGLPLVGGVGQRLARAPCRSGAARRRRARAAGPRS